MFPTDVEKVYHIVLQDDSCVIAWRHSFCCLFPLYSHQTGMKTHGERSEQKRWQYILSAEVFKIHIIKHASMKKRFLGKKSIKEIRKEVRYYAKSVCNYRSDLCKFT